MKHRVADIVLPEKYTVFTVDSQTTVSLFIYHKFVLFIARNRQFRSV